MIKIIYFDVGGVLVTDGFYRAAPLFSKELGISKKKIFDAYIKTDDWRYCAGIIGKERWINFFKELGLNDVNIDKFIEIWHSIFVPIKETIKIVKKLKGKYVLGALTDQAKDAFQNLKKYHIFDLFKIKVISCQIGYSKDENNTKIYEYAIKKSKVKPEEILFIDNSQKNLDNASKKDIKTLLFKDPKKLEKDLVSLGIL